MIIDVRLYGQHMVDGLLKSMENIEGRGLAKVINIRFIG
jgi:hypothetical protein